MVQKIIAYIPVHIEFETEKQKKSLIRDLAHTGFGRCGGSYSYEKKKCRIKDIKITDIQNGKKEKTSK